MSSTDHSAAHYVVWGVYIYCNSNFGCDWGDYAIEVSDKGNEVVGKVLTKSTVRVF